MEIRQSSFSGIPPLVIDFLPVVSAYSFLGSDWFEPLFSRQPKSIFFNNIMIMQIPAWLLFNMDYNVQKMHEKSDNVQNVQDLNSL